MSHRQARAGQLPERLWAVAVLLAWLSTSLHPGPARANPPERDPVTPVLPSIVAPAKVALGEALFNDRRLSGSGRLACVHCHDIQRNGASARRHDIGDDGNAGRFNTPTLFNAVHNFRFSWQGSHRRLEDQIEASLRNPSAMGGDPEVAVARLRRDARVRQLAEHAYGRALDAAMLIDALSEYQRSLVTPGSRFDQWLQGDAAALNARELRGYRAFKSIGCVACHQGMNLGGNLFQSAGVMQPIGARPPIRLRVPTLRNIAATAPYFHDGSAATLDEAVRQMGASQLGIELQTADVQDIVSFLQTLSGRYGDLAVVPAKP